MVYGAVFVGALGLASAAAATHRRAKLISNFYIVGYLSNAFPAIAMGFLIAATNFQTAFYVFSGLLIALAGTGLFGIARTLAIRLP
ncbi:hypothetical protein FJU08_21615 [Martelella alba]|uniref:Major facilitator superfamily (MFS) profile domain-containing protein n=1 Tax=Martelella alba TaxID=2590451 RepID=A0A506U2H1_9HYPH|nr:hypothetical protein [Martelella alba]TPW26769.1 hypothetical protein FJU08_21615 [Martelella alba]